MERDGLGGFELIVILVGGVVGLVVSVVWVGATMASFLAGDVVRISLGAASDAATALPSQLTDPAGAWSPPVAAALPGPALYWACTLGAAAMAGVMAWLAARWLLAPGVGSVKRWPLDE
jgi:hypothetical protein